MFESECLCPVCGRRSAGPFMPCGCCQGAIENRTFSGCRRCGIDLAGSSDCCTACRDSSGQNPLDRMDAVGDWRGPLREWLSIYKYGGDARMADYLCGLLLGILEERWKETTLVPVPPRRERLKKEGFDPVDTLAGRLERAGVSVRRMLVRVGSRTQKGRARHERMACGALDYRMAKGAVSIDGDIVLLDDVCTTGATLNACASALKEAGAGRVYGLVVCRD